MRKLRSRNSDAAKYWKRKQESFKKELSLEKHNSSPPSHSGESLEEELVRLRKERDNLLEENRRLQGERRPESPSILEVTAFQSQLDTLQWQLKHVESNRQMYRAVMEQVLKFLERVQKCLDLIQTNKPNQSSNSHSPCKNKSRVPRSRSVHTVAHTSPNSRASSPSPTHQSYHNIHQVQRANSVNQMQDSYSQHSLREFSWRSSRPLQDDTVTPDKLSQETFRLLRTIQSLVNTREPDLAQRLTPSCSDLTLSERRQAAADTNSVGSCSSLLQSSYLGDRASNTSNTSGTRKSLESTSSCSTHCEDLPPPTRPCKVPPSTGPDDESGFSSLSSFHEGLPLTELNACPELGLPLVDTVWPLQHQRHQDNIRVLWV